MDNIAQKKKTPVRRVILFFALLMFGTNAMAYQDATQTVAWRAILADTSVLGGGSPITITVRDNFLTVTFNCSFQPSKLINGTITKFSTTGLPNVELGKIGDYTLKIASGFLMLSGGSSTMTRVAQTFTYDLALEFSNENYIYTVAPRTATTTSANYLTRENKSEEITYFDGLGRPIQKIAMAASPLKKDIVTHFAYDGLGRQEKEYMPFTAAQGNGAFIPDALTQQQGVLSTVFPDETSGRFYSQNVFDGSPLNRVTAAHAPGDAWVGKPVRSDWATNTASEVRLWEVGTEGQLQLSATAGTNGYYNAGDLYLTILKDENWDETATGGQAKLHTVREYKDKLGQVVLKRTFVEVDGTVTPVSTHYVYDDFGLLRYVIPPKANGDGESIAQATIDALCYTYAYDGRKRMVTKKLPGAAEVRMVYDRWDRLVLTQDGVQRTSDTQGKWTFTKYDVFNRPVMTGEVTLTGTHEALQEAAMTATDRYEEFGSGSLKGYTNTAYPTNVTAEDLLTVTFYDNYNFSSLDEYNSHFEYTEMEDVSGYSFVLADGVNTKVKGQVTGSLTRVLGTQQWLLTTTYYDSKYRVIQTISQNQLGEYTGFDVVSTSYDFVGQAMATLHLHNDGTADRSTAKVMTYDHAGRLTAVDMSLDGAANQRVVSNTYDELGQLQNKSLHGGIQEIDYAYNVRGWMTKINDPNVTSDPDRLFGMELLYTKQLDGSPGQFNGNIAAMKWTGQSNFNTVTKRGYDFGYDALNRLKSANYHENHSGTYTDSDKYDVPNIDYDLNGNIMSLDRWGLSGTKPPVLIDELDYGYIGNQLNYVNDFADRNVGNGYYDEATGYTEKSFTINSEYAYDLNGNMTRDDNKGITSVEYNRLNLPAKITIAGKGTIEYLYDAAGIKLEKLNITDTTTVITKYVGSYIYKEEYKNDSPISSGLDRILHDEGYITADSTWHYFLRDHLGNTRVDFVANADGTTSSVQDYHYYPFGMDFMGLNNAVSHNKFKYNGKELQDDHGLDWYDYGARYYSPEIARWQSVDPKAEEYYSFSPYNYVAGNPIMFVDPKGEDIWIHTGKKKHFSLFGFKLFSYDEKIRYTQNMKYEGDNKFVKTAVTYLNTIGKTKAGNLIIGSLSSSLNDYDVKNTNTTGSGAFNTKTNELEAGALMSEGRTSIEKLENISHELFHAYQKENDYTLTHVNTEVDAYVFGNLVTYQFAKKYDYNMYKDISQKASQDYAVAMKRLITKGFNKVSYKEAIQNFKKGSRANRFGHYNKLTDPKIKGDNVTPESLIGKLNIW